MLSSVFFFILRNFGPMGVVIVSLVIFYEGVPGVKIPRLVYEVPFVGPVMRPFGELLITGRVGRAYLNGVEKERLAWVKAAEKSRKKAVLRRKAKEREIKIISENYEGQRHENEKLAMALEEVIDDVEEDERRYKREINACHFNQSNIERLRNALNSIR